jgi:hypothetical protein
MCIYIPLNRHWRVGLRGRSLDILPSVMSCAWCRGPESDDIACSQCGLPSCTKCVDAHTCHECGDVMCPGHYGTTYAAERYCITCCQQCSVCGESVHVNEVSGCTYCTEDCCETCYRSCDNCDCVMCDGCPSANIDSFVCTKCGVEYCDGCLREPHVYLCKKAEKCVRGNKFGETCAGCAEDGFAILKSGYCTACKPGGDPAQRAKLRSVSAENSTTPDCKNVQ